MYQLREDLCVLPGKINVLIFFEYYSKNHVSALKSADKLIKKYALAPAGEITNDYKLIVFSISAVRVFVSKAYTLIFDPQPASMAKSMHLLNTSEVNSGHSIPIGSNIFLAL